ncbi:MAG: MotA/TolQ/ExbB proton channel family protein, partial [Deltaproteobacteria bacterium]
GKVMYLIAVCSLFSIAISIERIYRLLFRYDINAPVFMSQIMKLVQAKNIERAIQLCSAAPHAGVAIVAKAALSRFGRSEREIQDAVDEAALEVIPKLHKRTNYLALIANIATLLGLLGTLFGLKTAFTAVATLPAAQRSAALAGGIAIALNTTAFGLIVAIPTMVVHSFVQTRTLKIIDEIDEFSVKLINLLVARGKSAGSAKG